MGRCRFSGTAALWSPKVLRAGMGAHFGLALLEGLTPQALLSLRVPLLATSSHEGEFLHRAALPWPCAWVFGHEGQGVSRDMSLRAAQWVRIVQPGGEESLNVAAATAVVGDHCFRAFAVRGTAPPTTFSSKEKPAPRGEVETDQRSDRIVQQPVGDDPPLGIPRLRVAALPALEVRREGRVVGADRQGAVADEVEAVDGAAGDRPRGWWRTR